MANELSPVDERQRAIELAYYDDNLDYEDVARLLDHERAATFDVLKEQLDEDYMHEVAHGGNYGYQNYVCKRCGQRIPAASPDGLRIVYAGTVGVWSPDVPEDKQGLCMPCMADDAPTIGEAMSAFGDALEAMGEALSD